MISAFGAVMMPRMSNLYARSKYDECRDLFVRSMEIAIFIGCAITFGYLLLLMILYLSFMERDMMRVLV